MPLEALEVDMAAEDLLSLLLAAEADEVACALIEPEECEAEAVAEARTELSAALADDLMSETAGCEP